MVFPYSGLIKYWPFGAFPRFAMLHAETQVGFIWIICKLFILLIKVLQITLSDTNTTAQ